MGLDRREDFENARNQQDGRQMHSENEVYQNDTRMQKIGTISQHGMVFVHRFSSQVRL